MSEHYRPNGKPAQGYYCPNCGKPGTNMYLTGHHDTKTDRFLCEPNPKLVKELDRANHKETTPT